MKINGNEIRSGHIIQHQNDLWAAVKIDTVKPGKGPAYAQVELKNLRDGRKLNERFRASETVERVRLEQKDHSYLYQEGDYLVFMDTQNYEQINITRDMVGAQAAFLQDGMAVTIETHEGVPLGVQLPQHVTLEITQTEPTVKGQTAASSYKPAMLENGVRITVPPFLSVGEKVIVNTQTQEYTKRAD